MAATKKRPPAKKAPATEKSATTRKAPATAKTTRSTGTTPKKSTPAKKRAPRARQVPGVRGPAPLVLRGFTWTPPTDTTPGTATWAPKSPGAEVLAALAVGASWAHAAHYAHLHEETPSRWNNRGAIALADHDNLDALHATGPDPETLAYAAFHVAASEARITPVVGALDQIDRARRGGDWKAGAHQLKVLPQARDYRETTRTEVTGAGGGPVDVDVRADAIREALEAFQAEGAAGAAADPGV